LNVLQRGGNAIDASVAVAFVLAVVHPQAGNLGGGGFLTYYDASTRAVWTLDFTEVAPLAANRDMKIDSKSATAAAVPGSVAGLEEMHRKFGARPWRELVAPAISLAQDGFTADAELVSDAANAKVKIDGLAAGTKLKQPELAAVLQRIADNGAKEFYEGDTAKKLIEGARLGGGIIGFRDLREYKPLWRSPVKLRFGAYDIYTVPPPSAGGLVIGEVLNILASDDLAAAGFQTPRALHLLAEAERRAYIDRDKYLADPFSTRIPYRDLLSRRRAEQWRKSIDPLRASATATLTEPGSAPSEAEHTTHFTIADSKGNIAAVTTSLGDNFGSGYLVPELGFFLNNAMAAFTGAANAIEPGKRPATSMSPTIVLRNSAPYLAIGTRGGAMIPTTILQVFLNLVIYGKSLPDAVAAPRYHQEAALENLLYETSANTKTIEALNAMGHGVVGREAIGDVHAILFEKGRMIAVADPRRGGAAGGY
jgi:gamma-glutamyltranspeptidase/glutathione hydrolase